MDKKGNNSGLDGCFLIISAFFIIFFVAPFLYMLTIELLATPRLELIETSMKPVIAALESYKKANKQYPEMLEQLVPKLLPNQPTCPNTSAEIIGFKPKSLKIIYRTSDNQEYMLGCNAMWFNFDSYNSQTKTWNHDY
jgi:hypothetical protein